MLFFALKINPNEKLYIFHIKDLSGELFTFTGQVFSLVVTISSSYKDNCLLINFLLKET